MEPIFSQIVSISFILQVCRHVCRKLAINDSICRSRIKSALITECYDEHTATDLIQETDTLGNAPEKQLETYWKPTGNVPG